MNVGELTVLGARGTAPAPGADFAKYGGNTSSLALRLDSALLLLDAGTGIIGPGGHLIADPTLPRRVEIFLTHLHLDHICGLPHFMPFYRPEFQIRFHLASPALESGPDALRRLFSPPFWPVGWDNLSAAISFHELGEGWELEGLTVTGVPLRHPGGSTGFRVGGPTNSVVLLTDFEHPDEGPGEELIRFCRNADHMLFDAHFTPEEYERHRGWGHSTWEVGCRLAREAEVGKLWLYHHHPQRDDDSMDGLLAEARKTMADIDAARERLTFSFD